MNTHRFSLSDFLTDAYQFVCSDCGHPMPTNNRARVPGVALKIRVECVCGSISDEVPA